MITGIATKKLSHSYDYRFHMIEGVMIVMIVEIKLKSTYRCHNNCYECYGCWRVVSI